MSIKILFSCLLFMPLFVVAQPKPTLEYYLPNIPYNPDIPTPASWLGYEIGEWHATHDQLLGYMRALAASSNRILLEEYGRSYENRALVCLTISDPENLKIKDAIIAGRQQLADPEASKNLDLKNFPAVNYMGYSIHGNETSGSNAAFLVAYYLAAGQSAELTNLLKNTIILLDPCFNPDGMQRFSSWVNSHKSRNINTDPADDEYNESWPRGRTNHYGFDLNRDWLVAQQPESKGRVDLYQRWKPNVLTDHHEMGSNATFFFQPGVSSRVNPITPDQNQALTAKIAGYHAKLFSSKKILFYSGENYDDYYYGKGSTFPDAQGSIGILFEQGSSRGTAQETENGILTFPYTIRNQVYASLSTLQAIGDLRIELNEYLRTFFKSALVEAKKSAIKGYLFADGDIPAREFLSILGRQGIKAQNVKENVTVNGVTFHGGNAFFVPCEQPQYRLVRAIFERPTTFTDSIFYDISAWTLPDAFGLEWASLSTKDFQSSHFESGLSMVSLNPPFRFGEGISYAYAISPVGYENPKVLAKLLKSGLRIRVAMAPFTTEGQKFLPGTLVIAADRQPKSTVEFTSILNGLAGEGVIIVPIENGLTLEGPDLGSTKMEVIRSPKIIMLTGEGIDVSESGEIWHLLDTRYDMPLTMVQTNRFNSVNMSRYNVLILPDGNYGGVSADKVKQFSQEGGTVIATGKSLKWLKANGIAPVEFRKTNKDKSQRRPYSTISEDNGAFAMPGAIFEASLDLTHPLCFGYTKPNIPIFFGDTLFVEPGKNQYSTPIVLTKKPLLAGYVHPMVLPLASNAAGAIVYGVGKGKVICFPGNPNFRAFWYGTNRLLANAIFFGNLIDGDSTEKK